MMMKMMPLRMDLPYNILLSHNQHHTNHANIKRISSELLRSDNAKVDDLSACRACLLAAKLAVAYLRLLMAAEKKTKDVCQIM